MLDWVKETQAHINTRVWTHTLAHTHIHEHSHTRTHTHTYTRTPTNPVAEEKSHIVLHRVEVGPVDVTQNSNFVRTSSVPRGVDWFHGHAAGEAAFLPDDNLTTEVRRERCGQGVVHDDAVPSLGAGVLIQAQRSLPIERVRPEGGQPVRLWICTD
jgi:hypothetical protein